MEEDRFKKYEEIGAKFADVKLKGRMENLQTDFYGMMGRYIKKGGEASLEDMYKFYAQNAVIRLTDTFQELQSKLVERKIETRPEDLHGFLKGYLERSIEIMNFHIRSDEFLKIGKEIANDYVHKIGKDSSIVFGYREGFEKRIGDLDEMDRFLESYRHKIFGELVI